MYPAIMQTISAERDRAMREQAAAWRRAREARSVIQARPARIPFALIARFARNARSLPRQKRLQGSEASLRPYLRRELAGRDVQVQLVP